MFALSHSESLFPVWFRAVPPNPSSLTKPEAGLESWSFWDSCLGPPWSPFSTGAWAPSFTHCLQCSRCSGVPSPVPAFL